MSLAVTTDTEEWEEWSRRAGLGDAYFSLRYARIWEREELGEAIGIRYESPEGTVLYPVVRVPLDACPGGAGLCDIRTPYDFGGPLALGSDPAALLARMEEPLAELLRGWRVVTEFARIHPFAHRSVPRGAELAARNIYVDLVGGYERVQLRYHPNQRKLVRAARRAGLSARVLDRPRTEEIDAFHELYRATMARVGAADEYYFARQTIGELLALPEASLAVVTAGERCVAAACFLRSSRDLFYFLGASDAASRAERPNNLLFDEAIRYAIQQGCGRLHLGGGGEGLRRFKAQIGRDAVDYFVIKRVWSPADYARILAVNGLRADARRFPAHGALARELSAARAR